MDDTRRAAPGGAAAEEVSPPETWPPLPHLGGQSGPYLRFPGCRPVPLPRDRRDDFDEKIEYWDAATEIAWVAERPTVYHEAPTRRLGQLADRIGLVRGARIKALGEVGLVERDAAGAVVREMSADELLYLHPDRANLPDPTLIIGEHDLPDVTLEVDHSTDVRPSKLREYEKWGLPELWVVVPAVTSRRPVGVTIHVLQGGRYQQAPASVAFPGWTATEIFIALTEGIESAQTNRVVERVGRVLGAQTGTRPEDSPLIQSLTRSSSRQAYAAGRAAELVANVRAALAARGIRLAEPLPSGSAPFAGASSDAVLAAAVACTDEADFWRRLGLPGRPAS